MVRCHLAPGEDPAETLRYVRLVEFELQRLPLLTMPFVGPLGRGDRGVNRLRGDRQQDLLTHRLVDGLAGAGHTGRTARLVVAPQTAKVWRRAIAAWWSWRRCRSGSPTTRRS